MSLPGNAVDLSDHIEIQCSVRYNGMWTPVFICASHLPGISRELPRISTGNSSTDSREVMYRRVIAASDIEDFTELSCSMNFSLITHYRDIYKDIPDEPDEPVFAEDFVWKTPAIRIVNASGMYGNA